MPRKIKEVAKLLEKIGSGKATQWDIKNLGEQCRRFKESDAYEILKWGVERIISTHLRALPVSGKEQNSYEFHLGYLSGCRAWMEFVDEHIYSLDDIRAKERTYVNEKKEVESDIPVEPMPIPSDTNEFISPSWR